MGEVNRLQGTIRGGQFHVGAHRWPLGYTPAYQGPVDLFLRPWEVDISRRTSLDSPLRSTGYWKPARKGHYAISGAARWGGTTNHDGRDAATCPATYGVVAVSATCAASITATVSKPR